jgi:membrane associated rhomboid family serine protease
MTPTPVGMRCPECSQQRTKVRSGPAAFTPGGMRFPATVALIAINVVVYLIEIAKGHGGLEATANLLLFEFGLFGPSVAEGEWYRLLTSGFIHGGIWHIAGNMVLLFFLGRILEPGIGTPRFLAIYFASLFAGSLGVLVTTPDALAFGASGAVFGVMAATFVIARGRGVDALASTVGILILFNIAFSFGVRGISLGAHLGGLVAGFLCALLVIAGDRGMLGRRRILAELSAMVALGAVAVVVSIAVA